MRFVEGSAVMLIGGALDTISAIATAQGTGGVAIVRVSGEKALEIARNMFSRKGEYEPNVLYAGEIDCDAFRDFGMCVYFRAPRSFTGEDTVEFHCHGGTEIARGVLRATLKRGARLAERGEFTRRAFLSGKLSLSAAEGLGEMIAAQSLSQVRAGYQLLGEKLTNEGRRLQDLLKECLASVDADVDYPEEDLTEISKAEILKRLTTVEEGLNGLLSRYSEGKKIKAGVHVALCGAPNAGKSSLLNALLGYDRAIVSSIAGTTRDSVEGTIEIGGVLFHLTDTAGLRESADEIEREGVRRAEAAIRAADVVVYLKSDDIPPVFPEGVPVVTVRSKRDLGVKGDCDICLSSVTGEGLDELRAVLFERGFGVEQDGLYLMEERHYRAVGQALIAVKDTMKEVSCGAFPELYAEHLKRAWAELGTLSGETATEEIIKEIFSKFCVGK